MEREHLKDLSVYMKIESQSFGWEGVVLMHRAQD